MLDLFLVVSDISPLKWISEDARVRVVNDVMSGELGYFLGFTVVYVL